MNERVAAALGKSRERQIARLAMDSGVRLDSAPEVDIDQRLETIRGKHRLDPVAIPEFGDLT